MVAIARSETPELFEAAVQRAVKLLRAGNVVALPTETVYGLAANALNASAIEKVFAIKGRPAHNPLIVHVASIEMARDCVGEWPEMAQRLADAFWPGPLTLVLPKAPQIPDVVTAGGLTVGIRWPSHPVMRKVIELCGFPLAAPSANLSGQLSPTTAEHVRRSLDDRLPLIVDGGPSETGIESTVLDLAASPPRILRPGMIHVQSLAAVAGALGSDEPGAGQVLRSPGLLNKHYSPRAKLILWDGVDADQLEAQIAHLGAPAGQVHVLVRNKPPSGIPFGDVCVMPREPQAFGKALYAELHRSDEAGASVIVVEAVPDRPEWQAIADRLRRAAA